MEKTRQDIRSDATRLANNCEQYAQSPRRWCSRTLCAYISLPVQLTENGKYLSHIVSVDMRKNLRDIIRVSDKTVIRWGSLGCFDQHGIFPMNVLRMAMQSMATFAAGTGEFGVRRNRNRLAVSHDTGLTFQRIEMARY